MKTARKLPLLFRVERTKKMERDIHHKQTLVNIEDEMKKSYMDYAMSVIIGRAIPDVRDGLKPVHRRILFAMNEVGNRYNKPYKKSARIVGDIMGKYHPHGDMAIYDTLVRMAQDFSLRYMLIDGQGNFGSIDGDPPAAMRYTEIRLARIAEEVLADLEKDTVDYVPNYDETLKEPSLLASRIPLLLLNGSSGIAVGMATNIPPHNLNEIINGTIACIKNPEITVEKLMRHIPGPDFPTAGFINGREGILSAYKTGRGIIRMRARALIEKNARNDRESIILTELPYQVNKATLIEKIAELVRDKKISGVADLRDESDREGIRVVIDLKRDENSAIILNQLYKFTQMETSFGIIMLAILDGRPHVFNLKEVIEQFIIFRKEIVIRRTQYDLARAKERAHILEGYIIALNNIDEVIKVIKASKNPAEAVTKLCAKFKLSEIQAKAILEMRLQRLTGLERAKIDEEYREVTALIAELSSILADPQKVLQVIMDELTEIKQRYGDERRTEIVASTEDIDVEDMIVEEDMMVTITHSGYIKRNAVSLYKSQHRGGRGKMGMGTKEEDFVEKIFVASTHHYLLIFTNTGKVHWLKVYLLPQAGRAAKGKAIVNLVNLAPGERVSATLPVREFTADKFVVMVTKKGIIKKTDLAAYSNPRSGGIIAVSIDEGDELVDVQLTLGNQDIFLATRRGMAIRFKEDDVRDMGRTARGVRGISLDKDDDVIGVEIPAQGTFLMTVSENGFGKCTPIEEYRVQSRGGKGTINLKTVAKVGNVSGVLQVQGEENIMLISNAGKVIRLKVQEVPVNHRVTQGVKLIELDPEEKLVGVARTTSEIEGKDDDSNGSGEDETDLLPDETPEEK
jgi:DNA gyrase subunit A